jgi:hypothetical protein
MPATLRLVFATPEPVSCESLRLLLERHADELGRLGERHAASARVADGAEPVVEVAFPLHGSGPAAELEALAAVHELELGLAGEGLALRTLRAA